MRLIVNVCASLVLAGILTGILPVQQASASDDVIVLAYQDIPTIIQGDHEAVDRITFIQHIEYLRSHGYVFVGLNDIIEAHSGGNPLPNNAVLLSFDNAFLSFYEFIYPVLQLYRYPCVLSIVTSWIGNPPPELPAPLMNWEQLAEVAKNGQVTIASGTHNLGRDIAIDSSGNYGNAVTCLACEPKTEEREAEAAYRGRLSADLSLSHSVIRTKLGIDVNVLVWPGGRSTVPALEQAKALGYSVHFLDESILVQAHGLQTIPRHKVRMNQSVDDLRKMLEVSSDDPINIRAVRVDLDRLFTLDAYQLERNIDIFLDRMKRLGVTTVYLRGCSDPDGNGIVNEAYFPNRVIPMRADLFGRITGTLNSMGIQVYASMPMLRIALPGLDKHHFVHERSKTGDRKKYRISPFDDEAVSQIAFLYEDVAACAPISGILFEEDGFLNEREDFSISALGSYSVITGNAATHYDDLDKEHREMWARAKTNRLIEVSRRHMNSVRKWRPAAHSARLITSRVIVDPDAEDMYAQNFDLFLDSYDDVVILANPVEEGSFSDRRWLRSLVHSARENSGGISRTVFMVPSCDQSTYTNIKADVMRDWLRELVSNGASHIAYDTDDYINDAPDLNTIRLMISRDGFPIDDK